MTALRRFGRRTLLKGLGTAIGTSMLPIGLDAATEDELGKTIRPYAKCLTRMEHRLNAPPTKEYIDATLEVINRAHIQTWWFSAVGYTGIPLFPSHAYPESHPRANLEIFRYLIEQAHEAGVTMMSWYPMNSSAAITDAHPDWRMRFLEFSGTSNPEAAKNSACFNSPYREALYAFSKEVVGDLGFDGIWFDGSTFSNHATSPMFQPGCCCHFCQERFRRDTGLKIPTKVDFESRTFRRFLRWRYDVLMEVWRGVVEAVREANPYATVAFNNYRRRNSRIRMTWNTAIPLRRLALDAVMSCELDGFYGQADIEMKICRAMGGRKGLETWLAAADYVTWVPDVDPLNQVQASLGCLSGGGMLAVGVGQKASYTTGLFRKLHSTLQPRTRYLEGKPVPYVATLISQQSMDYDGQNDPASFWDAAHGANELMQHAHFLSEVVFDDHVERGEIEQYPVLIAGNASCMSRTQAERLEGYVKEGGVLIASYQAGRRDELGYSYSEPVLDKLLGIRSRSEGPQRASYEILDPALKVNESGFISIFAPRTKAAPVEGAKVFLQTHKWGVDRSRANWPGAWVRDVGKGKAVYFDADLFPMYLREPTRAMHEFFGRLLASLALPPVKLSAPFFVTMNIREPKPGEWWVHLHNFPGPGFRYPNPPRSRQLGPPGEVVPVGPITLEMQKGGVQSAWSVVSGKQVEVRERRKILIPALELHDVIRVVFA